MGLLRKGAICVVAMFGVFTAIATAQERSMELLASIGGDGRVIVLDDHYAYVGEGAALAIYDIDGYGYPHPPDYVPPVSPTRLSSLTMFGTVSGLAIKDSVLYVAAGKAGLRLIDVSDPAAPALVNVYELPGDVNDVTLDEDVLYAAWGNKNATPPGGLQAYSIQDSGALSFSGACDLAGPATQVAVEGQYAYVAWLGERSQGRLEAINIQDTTQPQSIASADYWFYPLQEVVAVPGRVYVLSDEYPIHVLDTTDPYTLARLGEICPTTNLYVTGFAVHGNLVYASLQDNSLQIFDASVLWKTPLLHRVKLPAMAFSVAVRNNVAYIGGGAGSLMVVGLLPEDAPAVIGFDGVPGTIQDLSVEGARAYTAQASLYLPTPQVALWPSPILGGFNIYDTADPAAPRRIGSYQVAADSEERIWDSRCSIDVQNDFAYLAWSYDDDVYSQMHGGLEVVDVSDAGAPQCLGKVETDICYGHVVVQDDLAFLLTEYHAPPCLDIADISNPEAPAIIYHSEELSHYYGARDISVSGSLVVISLGEADYVGSDFIMVDASTPSAPVIYDDYSLSWGNASWIDVGALTFSKNLLYAVCLRIDASSFGPSLGILNVLSPYSLEFVGDYSLSQQQGYFNNSEGVAVAYGRAYFISDYGIEAVDTSTSDTPACHTFYDHYWYEPKIAVNDTLIYVGSFDEGLNILSDHRFPVIIATQGSGTTNPAPSDAAYDEDSELEITAIPEPGYRLVRWEGDCGACDNENPLVITVDGKKEITAVFEEIQYTLSIDCEGQGYTNPAPGVHSFLHDTETTVNAIPKEGWYFDHWAGDCLDDCAANPIAIVMDTDKSLTAVFSALLHTLTLNLEGQGTLSLPAGEHAYAVGSVTEIAALPATGWRFDHWQDAVGATNPANPLSLTMDSDIAFTAVFVPIDLSLSITVEGEGTTSPEPGAYTYEYGDELNIAAEAAQGWRFDRWEVGLEKALSGNPLAFSIQHDTALTAVFVQIEHALSLSITGEGSTTLLPGTTVYAEGTEVEITATPAEGWRFDHWAGDCGDTPAANPLILAMDAGRSITAVFVQRQYTLTISVEGNGQASLPAGQHTYPAGSAVILAAIPDADWQFDHWEGDTGADSYANPLTVAVDADKSLTAVFRAAEKPFWSCGAVGGPCPLLPDLGDVVLLIMLIGALLFGEKLRKTSQRMWH